MAPELLRGSAISTKSDVYAFGILLWEVMTHRIPYDGIDYYADEILTKVRDGELRPDCDGLGKNTQCFVIIM